MKFLGKDILISVIICIIFVIMAFLIIREYLFFKLSKRIKDEILKPKEEDNISVLDYLLSFYEKLTSYLSAFFKKYHLFTKYSERFAKYLSYIKKDAYDSMDFVSSKFLITFFIIFLYFLILGIKPLEFNIIIFLSIGLFSFYLLDIILIILYKNKQKLIEEQLLQAIIIMNGAFKSGKNIYGAVQIIKNELPSPIKEEFAIIAKDLDYGLDIDTIFERFYERVKVEEARYITSSLALLNKTGGSVVSIFNMIEKRFYARLRLNDELKSLTATSKLLKNFLCLIPFFLILFILVLDYNYFKPLFTSIYGLIILGIIIVLYLLYIIVIRKIMRVDEV